MSSHFYTVFETHRKVSFNIAIEASNLSKLIKNCPFWRSEVCGQTVVPDRSVFIVQKLVENAKIERLK